MNNTILWEEKNSTEVEKSCSNNSANVQSDTTKTIRKGSIESIWKDIGGVRKWIRKCPECGDEAYIKSSKLFRRTKRCYSCSLKFRRIGIHPKRGIYVPTKEELTRKCPTCNCEIVYKNVCGKISGDKNKANCKVCQSKKTQKYERPEKLERNCPKCNTLIQYKGKNKHSSFHHYLRSIKQNRLCNKCSRQGILNGAYGLHRSGEENPNFGKKWSVEQKIKASKKFSGKNAVWYGRKHSEETREKMRNATLNNLAKFGKIGVGKHACDYLDKLSAKMGWKLQHAKNGGEFRVCGYLVDGYDKENNIVVEYNEPYHYNKDGTPKQKDIDRMIKIIQYLGCKFFIYDETKNKLIECGTNFNCSTIV